MTVFRLSILSFVSGVLITPALLAKSVQSQLPIFPNAIYGRDNRVEISEAPALAQEYGASVVAFIKPTMFTSFHDGGIELTGEHYGVVNKLCRNERFYQQTAYSYCTGVLIAPNIVLTAGHCINETETCENIRMVFDLKNDTEFAIPRAQPREIPADNVYRCKKVIVRQEHDNGLDFSLIELDRAPDRPVIPVDPDPQDFTQIFMIGHPMGLTQKFDTGEVFKENRYQWVTTLDSYGGNSGSPVFTTAGYLVGILTAGELDYEETSKGCFQSRKCTQFTCEGEYVFKAQIATKFLP